MSDDEDFPTVLSKLLRVLKQAGAPSEESTDRDGFLSHHAETHAVGVGIGVGAAAMTIGEMRYVAALLAIAFGANRGPKISSPRIVQDIKQEPHYALGGLAVGLFLGALISR